MQAQGIVSTAWRASAARRLGEIERHIPAGLCLGFGTGFFWAFLLFVGPLLTHSPPWLERVGPPIVLALVLGSWVAGGAGFGWVLRRRLGSGGRRAVVAPAVVGLAVTILGLVAALRIEGLAIEESRFARDLFPYVFTVAFAPHVASLVFSVALAAGLALRIEGAWRRGLAAAGLTTLVFVALSLAANQLPGWRVGGGERAMVKVALVAIGLAGVVGGTVASRALIGPRSTHALEPSAVSGPSSRDTSRST